MSPGPRRSGCRRCRGAAGRPARAGADMAPGDTDRFVAPLAEADERQIEGARRPRQLTEFGGQARLREQLTLVLEGAMRRGKSPDHVLLSGPPGLGKTTIAMIIAAELGAPLRISSGPAIERAGDLASVLTSLNGGEVVFIDEIHRLARPAEELLYLAMEDFRGDGMLGKGPGATCGWPCPRSPWPSRRKPRPWRSWPSPSWSGPA